MVETEIGTGIEIEIGAVEWGLKKLEDCREKQVLFHQTQQVSLSLQSPLDPLQQRQIEPHK
jgi:hypothetical protein